MWHRFHSCFSAQYLHVLSHKVVDKPFPPDTGHDGEAFVSEGDWRPCWYKTSRILLFVPWYNSCSAGSSMCLVVKYFLYSSWHFDNVSFLIALMATILGLPV